jgi:RND family efflux transporter MFP subunit
MAEKEYQKPDLSSLRINREMREPPEPATRKNQRRLLFVAVAVVLVGVMLFALFGGFASVTEVEATPVVSLLPSQADVVLTASGYVVAQRQAAVASKGTGRLEYLGVEEGDQVKQGQVIARLEHNDMDAMLEQARANLNVSRAALETAKAELRDAQLAYERQKQLLKDELVAQAEVDAAQARYDRAVAGVSSAEAGIKAAMAAVNAAGVQVENTNIRAPFDGTVLTKNADVGEIVAPFGSSSNARAAVVSIADMSSLEVEADVSESNIERIRTGQPCEVVLDAYPQVRYKAVVGKIVPTADRAKATVLTKVKFIERDERVLPEMSAKVTFLAKAPESASSSQPIIAVPSSAILNRDGRKVAFAIEGDQLVEREVDIGGNVGSNVEIRSGLTAGERVALDPQEKFASGMKVKIKTK